MANSDKTVRLKLELEVARASAGVKKFETQLRSMDNRTKEAKETMAKLNLEVDKLAKSKAKLKGFGDSVSIGMSGVSAASGSASASVLEMGRAISDSNYGMQGMANNLSQLASNLLFTTKKAGGFSNGLSALKSAFMGPLGLIVVFQTVIAMIENWSMASSKAASDTNAFKIELEELNSVLGQSEIRYKELIELSKERSRNAKEQEKIDEDLAELAAKKLKLEKEIEDWKTKTVGAAVDRQKQLLRRSNEIIDIDKEMLSLTKKKQDSEQSYLKVRKLFEIQNSENVAGLKKIIDLYKKERDELSENSDKYDSYTDAIEIYEQKIKDITGALNDYDKATKKAFTTEANYKASVLEEITQAESDYIDSLASDYDQEVALIESKYFRLIELAKRYNQDTSMLLKAQQKEIDDIEIKRTRKTRKRTEKAFRQKLLNLEREILGFRERDEKSLIAYESIKKEIEAKFEKESLTAKYEKFKETEKLRLDNFKASSKSSAKIAEAQALFDESMIEAKREYNTASLALDDALYQESLDRINEFNAKAEEIFIKNQQMKGNTSFKEEVQGLKNQGKIGARGEGIMEAKKLEAEGQALANKAAQEMYFYDMELLHFSEGEEHRAELLMKRAEAEANYLKGREMMSNATIQIDQIETKSKAQMVSDISSLLSTASSLAGKETAAGKALAIASTTISTYSAAQGAYESQMTLSPDSPIRAQIAYAAAIAKGLANVKSIMAVKVPNGGGSGGGATPADTGRTFDFNLVGSTGQNQLAQGIAGQFGQPVQAYVVSSNITSQQQLDSQIQSSATLGD